MTRTDRPSDERAEALFAEFLGSEDRDEAELERLCRRHPEVAEEMRRRFEDYLRVTGTLNPRAEGQSPGA